MIPALVDQTVAWLWGQEGSYHVPAARERAATPEAGKLMGGAEWGGAKE